MAHFDAERKIVKTQISNRLRELSNTFFRLHQPITGWETVCTGVGCDVAPIPVSGWQTFEPPSEWGGDDVTNWFRATVTIPDEMAGLPVYAILPVGGEALCRIDGIPHRGLDENRWPMLLASAAKAGTSHELVIEAWSRRSVQRFGAPRLAVRDELAWTLYWDLRVVFEASAEHTLDSAAHVQMLDVVDRVSRKIDKRLQSNNETWHNHLNELRNEFADRTKKFRMSVGSGALTLASHSHIDVAWMWPLRETRRKVGRTWSTVLGLMDEYPEVTFLQSQPQLYEYVRDHYPTLWKRVKERVKEGRWEVNGAAWVEQDMNIPCGESHVRQFLYGNRFYRKEFGIHSRMVWLPDGFGFTYSLPQIMKKAQIDVFGTWKLLFNQYQQHPYCFFRWRGIDGTEVPALSLPTLCGGDPNPHEVKRHWDAFRQKDLTDEFVYVFGHGDGGGGPTAEMFEYVRREENLLGIPQCRFGSFQSAVDEIVDSVEWDRVPVFDDELYFELHRGCLTSQAQTKRNNRRSELVARDAEYFATRAWLNGADYPTEAINNAWKLILLNQFHDILPGSSIGEVYDDANEDYAKVFDAFAQIQHDALLSSGNDDSISVHNTLGWDRNDVAMIPLSPTTRHFDVSQIIESMDGQRMMLVEPPTVPGFASVRLTESRSDQFSVPVATESSMENDFFRIEIATDGTFRRVYDKRYDREVLDSTGRANDLVLYDDRPAENDAWDIDFNYTERFIRLSSAESIAVVENGPIRATVRVVKRAGQSTITQNISMWRSIPRIDIHTVVDWHEKNTLLKALFPVNVRSRTATYEIQYGAIERPTHFSTSHDRARFEVSAQRWFDLSEHGYGVSLLNDSKYGHNVKDNVMSISLLRSSTNPDPNADQGLHDFTYSLYPHAGSWQEAGTVRRAYELNVPLVVTQGVASTSTSLLVVDAGNIVIDWVKKAEDSDTMIVRLYEAHGARGPATVRFANEPASVCECDLMEENDTPVLVDSASVRTSFSPWEIKTLKVAY